MWFGESNQLQIKWHLDHWKDIDKQWKIAGLDDQNKPIL